MPRSKADVLIVDDRPDGLIALEAVLSSDPRLNIIKANSGQEALELMPDHDFAVVLLDVQMPGMDGFETAAHIRENERSRHMPIIFVTAINKDERYVWKGYDSGAVDYLFKPVDPHILRSKVSVFVDLHIQAQHIRQQDSKLLDVERKARVRELAQLELEALRRYRSLADAVPHLVWRTRSDSSPEYFNHGWTEYTGISMEASLGEGWQRVVYPDDLSILLRTWLDALVTDKSFETECRLLRKDGAYRWHLVRAVAEKNAMGDVVAWIGSATDIDDRRRAEDELMRAKTEAEAASEAKTQFLANMSHEIRTPLSAILGFSELLLGQSETSKDQLHYLTAVRRNGEQLLHLINEILDISKVEAGKLEIEHIKVDLSAFLKEMRSVLELKAQEKGLSFRLECSSRLPAEIWIDPVRLRQVVLNLMTNAIKFTPTGSVHVLTSFEVDSNRADRGQLKFNIIDTGIGIPPDRVERLFQPFMQADSSTTRKFGGTGLGLALAKRLAELMDGDVRLMQSTPSGTEFEVTFGVACSFQRQIPAGQVTGLSEVAPMKKLGTPLKGRNILVVDDSIDNQELITHFLFLAGAAVEVASNGQEAVDLAQSKTFDLILMDIQMPVMDGYQATKTLRRAGYQVPIIALTAHAMISERDRCLSVGFDDHFSKPFEKSRLIETIVGWIEKAPVEKTSIEKVSNVLQFS